MNSDNNLINKGSKNLVLGGVATATFHDVYRFLKEKHCQGVFYTTSLDFHCAPMIDSSGSVISIMEGRYQ